ncbi:MAG: DUF2892 domain-containing protein [Pirellulaceae bacterium]|nr:DUF2892 domain-containing protein [Pirellulaceae bacterium]
MPTENAYRGAQLTNRTSNRTASRNSDRSSNQQNRSQKSEDQASSCENVGTTERLVSAGLGGLLVATGVVRGRLPGLLLSAVGASLLYRGLSGYCALYQQLGLSTCDLDSDQSDDAQSTRMISERGPLAAFLPDHDAIKGVKVEETFVIDRSAHDLYEVWTRWEELPKFLPHIKSIKKIGAKRTQWIAEAPLGMTLTWDADILKQDADRMVSWKSVQGDVGTAGSVHFKEVGDQKTEMRVSMQYDPPGGKVTAMVAEFFNMGLDKRVRDDLEKFKERLDAHSEQKAEQPDANQKG